MKRGQKGLRGNSSAQDLRGGQDDDLVYLQSSLHAIDAAPEPKDTMPNLKSYAMSVSDLMDRSGHDKDSSRGARERSSSLVLQGGNDTGSGRSKERSLTQVLQGSANSILKGVTSTPVSPSGRRLSEVRNLSPSVSFAPATPPLSKRVMGSSSEPDRKPAWDAIQNLDDSSTSSADQRRRKDDEGSLGISDSSSDSYDANNLIGTGMDASEKSHGNHKHGGLRRQNSGVSAGKSFQSSQLMGSVADLSIYSEEDEFQDKSNSSLDDDEEAQAACCGLLQAPHCKRYIRTSRVAAAVVRFAPCFWCFPIPVSATDRTILTRLNILSAMITLAQVVATAWFVIIMIIPPSADHAGDDNYSLTHGMAPNLWSLTGSQYSIGFFGAVVFTSNIVTLRVIRVVNLVGAIRYLWVLLYLLPFEIFFVVSLFDLYNVTHVWVKHWWKVPSMAWFREAYCEPGTAGTLCMVPILDYNESRYTEDDWCMERYQSTNCTAIRNAAQEKAEDLMVMFYNANLGWGLISVLVLYLIVKTLERIISRPMVQKSRESNVPAWLSLPFLGSTVVGAVFQFSPSSVLSEEFGSTYSWIGTAYIVCGGLFLLSGLLGWFISAFSILSSRDKRYKHLSVILFIVLMVITSCILMVIFAASIAYSVSLVNIPISSGKQGDIACGVDTADSCSNCGQEDPTLPKCPEWTLEDVDAVLQTQTKGSAALAVIFFIYSFSASRFGFVLQKHVTMYQIDYV